MKVFIWNKSASNVPLCPGSTVGVDPGGQGKNFFVTNERTNEHRDGQTDLTVKIVI